MDTATKEKLEQDVRALLEERFDLKSNGDGTFSGEIYADYRDELDSKTAVEICESDNPWETFDEKMDEGYMDYECHLLNSLCDEVIEKLDEARPDGLTDEERDLVIYILRDMASFAYPADHYLKQAFRVNIMLDTGDLNYDYVLNSVYPCWYGEYGARIDDKAGIVWLAKSQGYTKTQLWKALQDGDMAHPKGFLESMRAELANLPSSMSIVTFLCEMTLEQLISLNTILRQRDKGGYNYNPCHRPYCGYMLIGKETMTGLFDPWDGGGSVFEIELERDVRLPLKLIRSVLPDGGEWRYSVGEVYAMCGSAWRDSVKEIHLPKKTRTA